jgi:bifunctional DNA-binding transcriptional regulator/antitoxin component of YhaV-PrlF toxin-antitoxin module
MTGFQGCNWEAQIGDQLSNQLLWHISVNDQFAKEPQLADRENLPIRMAANGRLSIPAKQRRALGLEKGGVVVSTVENGELRIRTMQAVLDELRARLAPSLKASGDTVGQFIADRRAEAEREETEYLEWKAGHR